MLVLGAIYKTGFLLFRGCDTASRERPGLDTGSPSEVTAPLSEAVLKIESSNRSFTHSINTAASITELFIYKNNTALLFQKLHNQNHFIPTMCQRS